MTKSEALSRIEMIEGMTGSRAIALVDALDALGLLQLTAQLERVLADRQYVSTTKDPGHSGSFRAVKDGLHAHSGGAGGMPGASNYGGTGGAGGAGG